MSPILNRLRGRLARVTSSGTFLPEIDGLRFVAISAVVLYHLNDHLTAKLGDISNLDRLSSAMMLVLRQGEFGVQLFFVISGFILALPFAAYRLENGPKVSLKSYYLRRLTRLEPPYFINLFLIFLLLVCIRGDSLPKLLPHLGASLGYAHNLIYGEGSAINFVAWSLEIEVQFYLLVPLLVSIFAFRQVLVRRGVLIAVMALIALLQMFGWMPELTILAFLQYFLAGFLLADIYIADWRRRPIQTYLWDAFAALAWVGVVVIYYFQWLATFLLPGLVLIAYMGAFRGVVFNRIFRSPWIVTIGGMCYTFYLYHFFVISAVGRFTTGFLSRQPYWLFFLAQTVLIGSGVIVVCGGLFLIFERPFMDKAWPQKLWLWLKLPSPPKQSAPLPKPKIQADIP